MEIIEISHGWLFSEKGSDEWFPAQVPGCVHTDLLLNKKIGDPFYRMNEKDLQWIDKTCWIYKTNFRIDAVLMNKKNIRLDFKGLDTCAFVYLNGELLFKADNMFREWKAGCKGFIKSGDNELKIEFRPPAEIGFEKLQRLGFQPPAVNDQSENGGMGENRISVFIRKAPYHFGWDWGPRLVTSGIWRPIYLEAWDDAVIENAFYFVEKIEKHKAIIFAEFEIHSSKIRNFVIEITDLNNKKILVEKTVHIKKGENKIKLSFEMDNPILWWINGLGDPYLYILKTELKVDGKTIDEKTVPFGIRTVKVVQKSDQAGRGFYFELNGVPVFMKGANYIPNDSFPSRVPEEKYEKIIQSAKDVNMNMLRVWGGGIYENDIFYDLCDRKGILVWHDFMFACSMYPLDNEFENNIRQEFIDNIKRLRNHTCIAIWCGNNEIQNAWGEGDEKAGWGWKQKFSKSQRKFLWESYYKNFYKILPEVLKELDNGRYYRPSSPIADYYGYDGKTGLISGDNHYWAVWHNREPFEKYAENTGRFMSEYGFQSYPEIKSVKNFVIPEDFSVDSEVMSAHQRNGKGNEIIRQYMERYYKMPEDFKSILYLSQVLQAEGIKTGVEAHRSKMPVCMGSLYWQLNDCWPAASWSSIDYYGRWKALHYFMKKAFGKFLVCAFMNTGNIEIFIISDNLTLINAVLEVKFFDFSGIILKDISSKITVKPNSSEKVLEIGKADFPENLNPQNSLLVMELIDGKNILTDNICYFLPVKELMLIKPLINTIIENTDKGYIIKLETDYLAKNVYLSFEKNDGFFSDNYFDLIPGRKTGITFTPDAKLLQINDKLKIMSIADIY